MRSSLRLITFLLVLGLAGCATGDVKRPVPIAGGKYVGIVFGPNGPANGKADGYEIHLAGLIPATDETQAIYIFGMSVPEGTKLKRVRVDDISEEENGPVIDDTHPWLDNNHWVGRSTPMKPTDPLLKWVYTVTNSLRVYRFIVTDEAGHQSVLYQVAGYPDFRKVAIRKKWGEKY